MKMKRVKGVMLRRGIENGRKGWREEEGKISREIEEGRRGDNDGERIVENNKRDVKRRDEMRRERKGRLKGRIQKMRYAELDNYVDPMIFCLIN